MTLLICSAFPPEIRDLQEQGGKDWMTATLGVGVVGAASGIVALLERHPISRILFTGTCGAFDASGLTIGDVVRARTVHLVELSSWCNDSFFPDTMPTTVTPTRFLAPHNVFYEADVFCPLAITKSELSAALLHIHLPRAVENLECFSVAWNAAQRGIPFEAVLGVSNIVGPNGHQEWLAHHDRVSRIVQQRIQKIGSSPNRVGDLS